MNSTERVHQELNALNLCIILCSVLVIVQSASHSSNLKDDKWVSFNVGSVAFVQVHIFLLLFILECWDKANPFSFEFAMFTDSRLTWNDIHCRAVPTKIFWAGCDKTEVNIVHLLVFANCSKSRSGAQLSSCIQASRARFGQIPLSIDSVVIVTVMEATSWILSFQALQLALSCSFSLFKEQQQQIDELKYLLQTINK